MTHKEAIGMFRGTKVGSSRREDSKQAFTPLKVGRISVTLSRRVEQGVRGQGQGQGQGGRK